MLNLVGLDSTPANSVTWLTGREASRANKLAWKLFKNNKSTLHIMTNYTSFTLYISSYIIWDLLGLIMLKESAWEKSEEAFPPHDLTPSA